MDSIIANENGIKRSTKNVLNIRLIIIALILGVIVSYYAIYYTSTYSRHSFMISSFSIHSNILNLHGNFDPKLYNVMKAASMDDKTVIITISNKAWSERNALLDVFLEGFKIGNGTLKLLNHLVIVSYDQTAHERCLRVHHHCYRLNVGDDIVLSNALRFDSPDYREMMWKRIDLLASVLEMGFNFVFTDADIVWLQDPFPRFNPNSDFQIASDDYQGNRNYEGSSANCGFKYIKNSEWNVRLKLTFLDTTYFGGFCQHGKDISRICTMHANCCIHVTHKIYHLKILLEHWKRFYSLSPDEKEANSSLSWRVPRKCKIRSMKLRQ
ncbi:hypothetical protein ACFE04_017405 [Oxalis oulophora]